MNISEQKKWYREMGHRLSVLRRKLGISENEMANAFRVTLRTYRARESGGRWKGGQEGTCGFARKYKVSFEWLLTGKGPIFRDRRRAAA